jgi:hypothetical protein
MDALRWLRRIRDAQMIGLYEVRDADQIGGVEGLACKWADVSARHASNDRSRKLRNKINNFDLNAQ